MQLEKLIEKLNKEKSKIAIYPPQDFQKGLMWYSVNIDERRYLINSNLQLIDFNSEDIKLINSNTSIFTFSAAGILKYLRNESVNVSELFYRIKGYFERFIFYTNPDYYSLIALWVMGTYVYRIFNYFPYLHITAEKGSGKTSLLKLMSYLAFNGQILSDITPAVLFRTIDANGVSLFIDEFETLNKDLRPGLMDMLKTGFLKGATVPRTEKVKDTYIPKQFNSYSPKVLAGVSDIDHILFDRCILVPMLRNTKQEPVERYKECGEIEDFKKQTIDELFIFGLKFGSEIAELYNSSKIVNLMPDTLTPREIDIWEGLFTIAKLVDADTVKAMIRLATLTSKERVQDDILNNPAHRLINALEHVLGKIEPIKVEDDYWYYQSDMVYSKLKDLHLELRKEITSLTMLSKRLKRLNIENTVKNISGKSFRTYELGPQTLAKLKERFGLTYAEEPEQVDELPQTIKIKQAQDITKEIFARMSRLKT